MNETSNISAIASLACGSLGEMIETYINIWNNSVGEWLSLNIGDPVNRILIVSDPGMLADEVISNVISLTGIHSVKNSPQLILNRYPALETLKEKLIVFTTYPTSREDERALAELAEIARKNKNIFLISLVDNNFNDVLKVKFEDIIRVKPPSELARKEIISKLVKPFLENELVDEEIIKYLVELTDGMNTHSIISFIRRLIARSIARDTSLSRELIDEIFLDIVDEKKTYVQEDYDLDLLEQLYQMAVEENETAVFMVLRKLKDELPLSLSDQRILARYPFLLLGRPRDRFKLFFKARTLVKKFSKENGGSGNEA